MVVDAPGNPFFFYSDAPRGNGEGRLGLISTKCGRVSRRKYTRQINPILVRPEISVGNLALLSSSK